MQVGGACAGLQVLPSRARLCASRSVVYINWLPSKQKENGVRACARGSWCGLGPVGIDKYNKKIMIATMRSEFIPGWKPIYS
jgi:hypothetical protein